MDPEPTEAETDLDQESGSQPLRVPLTFAPTKSSGVLELDLGDGLILYNHEADLVHHLNPSAAIVWQLCDGDATVRDLAREIAEAYGQDVEALETHLARLIAELDALGLVSDRRFRIVK